MPARLVALDGGPDICVDGEIMVGRDPGCDARINSESISRRHCVLTEGNGGLRVRDLNSTNGTWINSQQVRTGWLRPGDILEIAYVRFLVADAHAERASRADAPNRLPADCSVLAGRATKGLADNG
jgi:pSer/pThr/pTyr-binding forkhead associated (FHA) protein